MAHSAYSDAPLLGKAALLTWRLWESQLPWECISNCPFQRKGYQILTLTLLWNKTEPTYTLGARLQLSEEFFLCSPILHEKWFHDFLFALLLVNTVYVVYVPWILNLFGAISGHTARISLLLHLILAHDIIFPLKTMPEIYKSIMASAAAQ